MKFTQTQIDDFHRQGFLACPRLLDAAELPALRTAYDAAFTRLASQELAGKGQRMRQIMNLGEHSPPFERLRQDARIIEILTALIGPNLQLWHDQALWKPARDGGPVFWHQDNSYWNLQPATAVSCWLTLDDADADNGAMQVIPGSHLHALTHGKTSESAALVDASAHVDPAAAVTVPLPAGGCLFHHCQTLHYTAPNVSDRQRRAFIVHAMAPGTRGRDGQPIPVDDHHPLLGAGRT